MLDWDHLFVNTSVKDSVDAISKLVWHQVADHDSRIINKSLVVVLVEKQNNVYACRTFSKDVEETHRLPENQEADITRILPHWYENVSALERRQ